MCFWPHQLTLRGSREAILGLFLDDVGLIFEQICQRLWIDFSLNFTDSLLDLRIQVQAPLQYYFVHRRGGRGRSFAAPLDKHS